MTPSTTLAIQFLPNASGVAAFAPVPAPAIAPPKPKR